MQAIQFRDYEALSPFEIKDALIQLARKNEKKLAHAMLNAGRGNPNWVATSPREAFFLLGQFAITECKRVMDLPGVGGMPARPGIAGRLEGWLGRHADMPGADFLEKMVSWAVKELSFDAEAFVHELCDSIIGDNYPVPDRMLVHAEQVSHRYLMWAMCGDKPPKGKFDLYAVEGGTAAMCYVFKSLKANRLLLPGDTIAMGSPIFTPYIEMPELEDYGLHEVYLNGTQETRWQFSDDELKKLEDPKVKAFFLVNPGNPSSVAVSPEVIGKLVKLVQKKRPDLIILTDDVYGTFVKGFRSLMADLPHNTIGVYSYSKYFGCTGWRLGVVAAHERNILDEKIAAHDEDTKKALDKRYGSLTLKPREMKWIDRLVADSRDVALNHTAGLSLPQQVMMTLFSLSELMDTKKVYQNECMKIVENRAMATVEGLGIEVSPNTLHAKYYGLIDLEYWMRKYLGEEVVEWMKKNVHPLDMVFRLAEDHGIVLLNGSGFAAPNWSCRVSFANLNDDVYDDIGRAVRAVARNYAESYQAATGKRVTLIQS